jgi:hypothetical protein
VIEAKLYANVQASALNRQMENQERRLLRYLRQRWPGLHTIHAALLPEKMKREFGDRGPGLVVTWEQIRDKYEDVESARYFHGILRIALSAYETLRERPSLPNADGELTGAEILHGHQNDTLRFKTMGRQGGIDGDSLKEDIKNDTWREQRYQVRDASDALNQNWFPVSVFVKLLADQGAVDASAAQRGTASQPSE